MRLPKIVKICGMTYAVETDSKSYDGTGLTADLQITIGTKSGNDERKWEILLHEIMELAACEKGYRYGDGQSDESIFVMNHKEFDNFAQDVAAAIRPMIKG